ncbi:DUF6212 domain-containing protein [Dongia rigui]|uniref:DUF6212 domain-containing protein n=1 Tax=Dongia rigui TaxID=940149 RepID=A0ABU5DUE4_9PROT|nr:DUF6212 domain-containing protein [Dongia rigui]MDY0870930.1 DUF6212 domain-containing protein [Dongia rigui]
MGKGARVISAATIRNQDIHILDQAKRGYVKKPAILFSGQPSDDIRALAGDAYALLKIKRVADDHILTRDVSGQDQRLAEAPVQLAAIIAFDQSERELVDRAGDWLQKRRNGSVPTPQLIAPDDVMGFAASILGTAQQLAQRSAELTTSLFRQLADARQANEDLQNRFAALEAFIDRAGLQPFDIAFINPPVEDETEPNVLATASNGSISQILPVASTGVSAIALHIAKATPRGEGIFRATLQSVEDGRMIENWSVPISELNPGWMTLALQKSIAGLRRTLRLIISVEGHKADLPTLSLGNAQPLPLFRLQDADLRQSISSSSLALQVYVGLPGVVPPTPGTFAARGGREKTEQGLREVTLPQEILAGTQQVALDTESSGFDGVRYLEGERIVSCHPPAFGTTIGKIPGGCPAGALRVSANLLVAHEKARDVEFALVAGNSESRIIDLLAGSTDPQSGEGFSGWIRVPAQQPRFASLYLDAPARTASDLYLVTRMVEAGNHDFAWARFLNVHALVQG